MMPSGSSAPVELEVRLEELGEHSWVKALLNTLTVSHGSVQCRFVAHPCVEDRDARHDIAVGATFPAMRLQDLDDRTRPNAWIEIAEQRLDELDRQLKQAGWVREPGTGQHWWSLTYRRS